MRVSNLMLNEMGQIRKTSTPTRQMKFNLQTAFQIQSPCWKIVAFSFELHWRYSIEWRVAVAREAVAAAAAAAAAAPRRRTNRYKNHSRCTGVS